MSYWIKWGALSLIPVVVVALVDGLTDADWPLWIGIALTVAALALTLFVGWFQRWITRYTVTNQRIMIRRGFLSKEEHSTHIDRVQSVTIRQTVIDRILSVGSVDFDTAATDDFQYLFTGVDDPAALRELIAQAYGERIQDLESPAGTR
jgi:uncharacterized membrane protein YdbT with pleckstrin-like domain